MNGDNVVQDSSQIAKVSPLIAPLFSKQGYQESSTAGPFEDYVAMGMGKAPLVLIYEAQFVEYELQHSGARRIWSFPSPANDLHEAHVRPAHGERGQAGELARHRSRLKLAADYGLRTMRPIGQGLGHKASRPRTNCWTSSTRRATTCWSE